MLNINLMLPNNENVRKYYMGKVQVSGVHFRLQGIHFTDLTN